MLGSTLTFGERKCGEMRTLLEAPFAKFKFLELAVAKMVFAKTPQEGVNV